MAQWKVAPSLSWWQTAGDFALAVLHDFGGAAIGIAILSTLLTLTGELLMSLYQTMVNRFVIPVIEAHEARGRAEGRAEERTAWREWNRRRMAAEAQGAPFNEPPPGEPQDDEDVC